MHSPESDKKVFYQKNFRYSTKNLDCGKDNRVPQTVDKVGFCHCEHSDAREACDSPYSCDRCHDKQGSRHTLLARRVGVAIRIPRKPHQIGHSTGERIPTPVLRHWLGMTGVEVCLHIETAQPGGFLDYKRLCFSWKPSAGKIPRRAGGGALCSVAPCRVECLQFARFCSKRRKRD